MLFASAGLEDPEVTAIDIATPFASFDEYWRPFLGGQGPAPAYVTALDERARTRLRRDGRDFSGTIVDVDPSGDLLLQSDDGVRMRFESATTTRIWD